MNWIIERYTSIGSTMEVADKRARMGAPAGVVVVAGEQTEGRGQRGRRWIAPAGSSLLMTVVCRPGCPPERLQALPAVIGWHVIRAIERITGLRSELKHPNDVLAGGRKLAGVLCQSSIEGETVRYVLIGIGLNVNIPPDALPLDSATSLQIETGRQWDLNLLLDGVLDELNSCWCCAPTQTA